MKCDLNGKECPIGERYGACFYCGQASVLYGHFFRVEKEPFKLCIDKDYAVSDVAVQKTGFISFEGED